MNKMSYKIIEQNRFQKSKLFLGVMSDETNAD